MCDCSSNEETSGDSLGKDHILQQSQLNQEWLKAQDTINDIIKQLEKQWHQLDLIPTL